MTKINQLISQWPRGAVLTALHMKEKGISQDLLKQYKAHRWIEPVGRGAYKLPNDHVDWLGGLYAVQSQLGLTIHAGGKTALELKGYAHYLATQVNRVFLYGLRGERLPKWFISHNWGPRIHYSATNVFASNELRYLSEHDHKEFVVRISSPELGAMEMLYYVPRAQGFSEAFSIMEGLATLRPEIVQQLLERCRSVKVKRLFMYMAEKAGHRWVKQLILSKVDFGKGKRVIVEKGVLDKKYNMTVLAE